MPVQVFDKDGFVIQDDDGNVVVEANALEPGQNGVVRLFDKKGMCRFCAKIEKDNTVSMMVCDSDGVNQYEWNAPPKSGDKDVDKIGVGP